MLSGEQLAAPNLLDHEVGPVLRLLISRGLLTAPRAFDVLTDLEHLRIRRWPSSDGNATSVAAAARDLRLARTIGHDVTVEVR